MKSVLLSIQPKWVEKIASGEKTIEVRKTKPKLETPFKVYIYMSQGSLKELHSYSDWTYQNRMKVIGEFICDRIEELQEWELSPSKKFYEVEKSRLDLFLKESCLSYDEICEYRKNLPYFKPLYGWHISKLVIYDKQKELSELWVVKCTNKRGSCIDCQYKPTCMKRVARPPQSYFYVEEV